MKMIDNPYNFGAGAPPPELAGRDDVIEDVRVNIERAVKGRPAKSFMMLGLRGVGKTVLLIEFEQMAETHGCQTTLLEARANQSLAELLVPQLRVILTRLDRLERAGHELKRAFTLLQSIASQFKIKYDGVAVEVSEPTSGDLTVDLTELFLNAGKAARDRGTAIVILIDEVHDLSKEDLTALIMALHKISQRKLPVLLFGAGLPQLAKLAGDAKSYAERLFEYPEIDRLGDEAARRALVAPAKELGETYTEEAVAHILRETQGYPFFLQLWGSKVWGEARKSPISLAAAERATVASLKALDEGLFNSRFERLSDQQRYYARAMAELGPEPARSSAVAKLLGVTVSRAAPVRDEMIQRAVAYSPSRGLIAFTVPLFDAYMKRKIPQVRGLDGKAVKPAAPRKRNVRASRK